MGRSRKGRDERIEPRFGTARGGMDLRAHSEDRPWVAVAAPERPSPKVRGEPERKPAKPERKRPAGRETDNRAPEDRSRKRRKRRGLFGTLMVWGLTASVWLVILAAGVIAWYAAHLPPTHALEVPPRPPNVAIVAADGAELANRGDTGGAAVPVRSLPRHVPDALIAIEDRRFRSHFGIDPIGLMRAAVTNFTNRGVHQGGSTLTQQLAKNLFLTPDRTMGRKIQEAVLALWLESNYSKDQILELYLNRVYFGAGAYGIEAAARRYYDKPATALTLQEAAVIAGLVKAPSRLAPTRNPEAAQARAQLVLTAMAEQGLITDQQLRVANADPARTNRAAQSGSINYVADWVMDLIDDYVGKVETDIVVETTIMAPVQQAAEAALREALARGGQRHGVEQGAVVVIDTAGAVRALVGGRDYAQSQFNRAVAARRQPGSAFKAFVYLAALERGLTPDTVRPDAPVQVQGWRPENYTRDYRGDVTLSQALAASLNTVAVRLGQEAGPRAVVRTAQRLGIGSALNANPSIALGTSEVNLLELTGAYAPFANGGTGVVPHVITRIRTASGRVLFQRPRLSLGQVVEPRHAAMMNAMMNQTTVSGTGRTVRLPGWIVAGKTGTSQDFRDAWFVGYTGRFVGGVWFGNDDGTPTRRLTGGGLPVDVWNRVMAEAHRGQPMTDLPGNWRSYGGSDRILPGETLDQPMAMTPTDARRAARRPAEPEDRSAVVRPQPGAGLFDRLFR
ncbi:transglycosylase domain-containing protein [Phreatobacter sp.]|uniref:transglycosylase domain-containing protein n=1 Tax=Phreatobacter sp. TaxID=1966341 RepID=UPI003F6E6165